MSKNRSPRLRIALYSHDTQGLGHIRRNMLIASSFVQAHIPVDILLISSAGVATSFEVPEGVDFLVLPAIAKDGDGRYRSRSMHLSLDALIKLRSQTIRAALTAFAPDLFIVDKVPGGMFNELVPTLHALCRRDLPSHRRTRCVLGLRDILDTPTVADAEWTQAGNTQIVRSYYDRIWVYGDPKVYDLAAEQSFGRELAPLIRYTGYLGRGDMQTGATSIENGLTLCVTGGGQDGFALAHAFVEAQQRSRTPSIVVTGPYMPAAERETLYRLAAGAPNLQIIEFEQDLPALMRRAERVICMGGYNTVCEILAYGKPTLVVPRVHPRQEQWIRAVRLAELGLIDVLNPDQLNPNALNRWLRTEAGPRPNPWTVLNLDGVSTLPDLLAEVMGEAVEVRRAA
ncbi:glycosyltransferase [bacterium]|nr:glycosyltransferase [bacterium]